MSIAVGIGAGSGDAEPGEAAVVLVCAEWGLRTKIFRYHTRCPRKPTRSAFHSSDGSK